LSCCPLLHYRCTHTAATQRCKPARTPCTRTFNTPRPLLPCFPHSRDATISALQPHVCFNPCHLLTLSYPSLPHPFPSEAHTYHQCRTHVGHVLHQTCCFIPFHMAHATTFALLLPQLRAAFLRTCASASFSPYLFATRPSQQTTCELVG
jgi:hypothetical protein